jgi:hypothetical protein
VQCYIGTVRHISDGTYVQWGRGVSALGSSELKGCLLCKCIAGLFLPRAIVQIIHSSDSP